MSGKWVVAGAIALLISSSLLGCGIPQEQYDATLADLGKVREELKLAIGDLEASQGEVGALTTETGTAKTNLDAAKAKNAELTSSLEKAQSELNDALATNATLKTDAEKLKKEMDATKNKITTLKSQIPTLTYNTLANPTKGFSINYPVGWTVDTVSNPWKRLVAAYENLVLDMGFYVTKEDSPYTISLQLLTSGTEQNMKSQGYTLGGTKGITINKIPASRLIYFKGNYISQSILLASGKTIWILDFGARSDLYPDWVHTFNEMINSFKLLGG